MGCRWGCSAWTSRVRRGPSSCFAVLVALLGTSLGLFVSAFAQTEFQAVQFMPAVILPQLLLCGIIAPTDQLPTAARVALGPAAADLRGRRDAAPRGRRGPRLTVPEGCRRDRGFHDRFPPARLGHPAPTYARDRSRRGGDAQRGFSEWNCPRLRGSEVPEEHRSRGRRQEHVVGHEAPMSVSLLSVTPVKGLALHHPDHVDVAAGGIVGDRMFFLVEDDGGLISCTDIGALMRHRSDYDPRRTSSPCMGRAGCCDPTSSSRAKRWSPTSTSFATWRATSRRGGPSCSPR